jgi:starvation-inducible DNA-binding protein
MEIKIGLTKKVLDEVCESLQEYLANTYALYLKTQNFHWNVKGPEFFSLHLLFEKHYEELAEAVDELAERVVSLGSHVDASFSGFGKRSSIKDSKKTILASQMLKELVEGHEVLSAMGRPLVSRFQELHDDASSDLIIKRQAFHEKAAWMLRSHLKSR